MSSRSRLPVGRSKAKEKEKEKEERALQELVEIGFPRALAVYALKRCRGNIEAATEFCVQSRPDVVADDNDDDDAEAEDGGGGNFILDWLGGLFGGGSAEQDEEEESGGSEEDEELEEGQHRRNKKPGERGRSNSSGKRRDAASSNSAESESAPSSSSRRERQEEGLMTAAPTSSGHVSSRGLPVIGTLHTLSPPPHVIANLGLAPRNAPNPNIIRRRRLLLFQVTKEVFAGRSFWRAKISTVQPRIKNPFKSPQGTRKGVLDLGVFPTEQSAHMACRSTAPPLWEGNKSMGNCHICQKTPKFLVTFLHHCRNCGSLVCQKCSGKVWPSSMIPVTYCYQESIVRVCDTCSLLALTFQNALRAGDLQTAIATFTTGNVNVHNPYSVYKNNEYPIHSAAIGGNLDLMQWLVEGRQCTLVNNTTAAPLRTKEGYSALDIAAMCGHTKIVKYLISTKKFARKDVDKAKFTCSRAIEDLFASQNGALSPATPPRQLVSRSESFTLTRQNSTDMLAAASSDLGKFWQRLLSRESGNNSADQSLFVREYSWSVALANQRDRSDSVKALVQRAIAAQIASLGIAHGRVSRSRRATTESASPRTQLVVPSSLHRRESGTSPRSHERGRKKIPNNNESDDEDQEEGTIACCWPDNFRTQDAVGTENAASSPNLANIFCGNTDEIEEEIEDNSECCAYLICPNLSCNDTPFDEEMNYNGDMAINRMSLKSRQNSRLNNRVQFDSSAKGSRQQQQMANTGIQEATSLHTEVKRIGLDNIGEIILAKASLVIAHDPPEAVAKLSSKTQLQKNGIVSTKEQAVSLGLVGEVFSAKCNNYEALCNRHEGLLFIPVLGREIGQLPMRSGRELEDDEMSEYGPRARPASRSVFGSFFSRSPRFYDPTASRYSNDR